MWGVTDDRRIVGVEDPLLQEERLCSIVADSISPRLVPNIEMITIEGKTLLIAEVFLSGSRPHFLKSQDRENGVYVRLGFNKPPGRPGADCRAWQVSGRGLF